MEKNNKSVSIIIPAYNEAESLQTLRDEIVTAFMSLHNEYEIIFINDGSSDDTQSVLEEIVDQCKDKNIRAVELKKNSGKATALDLGFSMAKGDIIITMDADLQDDPKEISRFIEKIEEGYEVISGWKNDRQDSFIKNKTSKIYNFFTSLCSGLWLHDHNCGFKAYKDEAVKDLVLYGQLHRYIPVLAMANGYKKITEIKVNHRKRSFGKTKYGVRRFMHGFLDLLTVFFITKYKSSPLHFFGSISMIFFGAGFLSGSYLTYLRIVENATIGDRPLLFLAILLMLVGVQIGTIGLISEQITHTTKKVPRQSIIKKLI